MKSLFVIDGASGTGKSDLLHYVNNNKPRVSLVRKYTTRSLRDYEQEKGYQLDLDFVSPEKFDQLGLDYTYPYGEHKYGFRRAELDECLAQSPNTFVIVRSADVIKDLIKDYEFINVVPVYIYTDQEKIRKRLLRQRVSKKHLEFRLSRIRVAFEDYLQHPDVYSQVLINNSTKVDYHRLIDGLLAKYKDVPEVDEKLVFVLMPLDCDNPDPIDYFNAVRRAVRKYDSSMKCRDLCEITGSSNTLLDMVEKNMRHCRLAIVDLTENKPNAYYELGCVHGIDKKCIITVRYGTQLPFHSSKCEILEYRNTSELEKSLPKKLKEVLGPRTPTINRLSSKSTSKSKPIKILFLAANPSDTTRLRLDEETREIEHALRQTEFRDKFQIVRHGAVRDIDLQGYLLQHKPDIVHFSGHGSEASEIILEGESGGSHPVSVRALSRVFSILKENVRCVVLNACYSETQAKAIAKHIDCVIGMSKAITDSSAIRFATAFYQALGYGKDVKTAFDLGRAEIDMGNLDEQDVPKLLTAKSRSETLLFLSGD